MNDKPCGKGRAVPIEFQDSAAQDIPVYVIKDGRHVPVGLTAEATERMWKNIKAQHEEENGGPVDDAADPAQVFFIDGPGGRQ